MGKLVLSFDAETNGLWGVPFAIAAIVCESDGKEIDRFLGRCPITGKVDPWVAENVLPQMENIEETHKTAFDLIGAFHEFYARYFGEETDIVVHVGFPVETTILEQMRRLDLIGVWEGPFPLHDTASVLEMLGEDSTTHGAYKQKHNIDMSDIEGGHHNPLFDAVLTVRVWLHLRERIRKLQEAASNDKS